MKKEDIYIKLVISLIIFLIIGFFIKGNIQSSLINTILIVSSFIFGIMVAFSIANRHSRFNSIREKLREQDALLLNLYLLSKSFTKETSKKIKIAIDKYLISQLDYELKDFTTLSSKTLKKLFFEVESIKPKNKKQESVYSEGLSILKDLLKTYDEVSYQIKNKMTMIEWISLITLSLTILFSLYSLNSGAIIYVVILAVLSTSLVLLLLILRGLDTLSWQEQFWIWEPLTDLFNELDLIPYYPIPIIKEKRINKKTLLKYNKIRIAYYPNKYPNMKGKKIKIIDPKKEKF
ncbi:hypothetical protein GOV12_06750 [Candidatus Pacearchaeota archaeon]|nr:hypothetical protein [Candidatus Pacearchaeota archaeon]